MTQELGLVIVGALAAILGSVIPTLIKGRADRIASEQERAEKRKNEIIRLEEKWIERDIEQIEAAADGVSTALREFYHLGMFQQSLKEIHDTAKTSEINERIRQVEGELSETTKSIQRLLAQGFRRAHSLGPEILTAYTKFDNIALRLIRAMTGRNDENQPELWTEFWQQGGILQEELRKRVLVIRRHSYRDKLNQ